MEGDLVSLEKRHKVSLEEFAKKNPSRKQGEKCWACTIKEAAEINANRLNGVQIPVIWRWLINECGYPEEVATLAKLMHHFSTYRHHERKAS